MSSKLWQILAGFATALSLILLAGMFVFPPCSGLIETAAGGSVPMKCHWTFRAEIPIAVLLILAAAGQFFLKEPKLRRLSSLLIIALGAAGIAITTDAVIGICMKAEMACHTTALFCRIVYGLLILAAGIQLLNADNGRRHKREF
ncbi:protein of unknown function [Desulfitobacterium chlororespirans DSM 11544]|uniref:DUF4418 domain-containing protein n=1 Tax=Desulfitobacterium chlororespirans DSM 11544 TaxID=1121395 RepID=A0A1M7SHV0_9FIRM|nr:protein of unknown function [Desulfitobacterium chlororespirans DSM 11544]